MAKLTQRERLRLRLLARKARRGKPSKRRAAHKAIQKFVLQRARKLALARLRKAAK